jgi:uncharacterized protein YjbI with pentapeptide repeats
MVDVEAGPEQAAAGGSRSTEPAPLIVPALAAKADDLDSLRTAVIDAAAVGFGLWVSYLFVLFYLLVAAGGVTHRDLFFESPVKLPFLNVDLPLKGFFWLGPALFLVVHVYVLLLFVMLADKIGMFDVQLRAQIADPEVRTRLRRQLPSNIFVQFLAGPRELRDGIIGLLLWLIALISLVIGPVALLVFFQLQFLPYHDAWVSWWQRIAVVVDLALLWKLWPKVALRKEVSTTEGEARRRSFVEKMQRAGTILAMLLITAVSVPLVFAIATFPGEELDDWFQQLPLKRPQSILQTLIVGQVDPAGRKPRSLWSNRLVLPGLDVIDHTKFDTDAKIAALPETASFRGRHLEGAVLVGARLQKVDFTGAHLEDARLEDADLRDAKLECAQPLRDNQQDDSKPTCSQLQRAKLFRAQLQRASFNGSQLQGASLSGAQLQGASLNDAQLHGASLISAQLQGASLVGASLVGASLTAALNEAHFEGARLDVAHLEGTSLTRAHLQGASLIGAHLEGASLEEADLEGASLDKAHLEGASLDKAHLEGASVDGSQMIRRDAPVDGGHAEGAPFERTELAITGAPLQDTHMDIKLPTGGPAHLLMEGERLRVLEESAAAHLEGTSLKSAHLEAALLIGAHLEGASLDDAHLEGASLNYAHLESASLNRAILWRADALTANVSGVRIENAEIEQDYPCKEPKPCGWSTVSFDHLRQVIEQKVPKGRLSVEALERIESRLNPIPLEDDEKIREKWTEMQRSRLARDAYEAELANQWRHIGCATAGAPYVLGGLIRRMTGNSPFAPSSPQVRRLAADFLKEDCSGARGLSIDDRTKLEKLAAAP